MADAPSSPKKRGRKRKQDLGTINNRDNSYKLLQGQKPKAGEWREAEPDAGPAAADTTSKRGRKRKQINYFELANPGNIDLAIQAAAEAKLQREREKRRAMVERGELPSENEEEEPKKRISPPKKVEPAADTAKGAAPTLIIETIEIVPERNGNSASVDQTLIEEDLPLIRIKEQTVNNGKAEDTTTPDSKKDARKYNYTGQTVKMMNQLFEFAKTATDSPRVTQRETSQTKFDSDGVTCAVCLQELDKGHWNHHKQRYHNDLAWRIGDQELDLTDQTFVMQTLNALYKKKKPLYCDKCGNSKKSVIGFLSHQAVCSKSEDQLEAVRISCEICNRRMLPVSLATHIKSVHSKKPPKEPKVKKEKSATISKSTKRAAAKKAMKLIDATKEGAILNHPTLEKRQYTADLSFETHEFARIIFEEQLVDSESIGCPFKCDFRASDTDAMMAHCKKCGSKPEIVPNRLSTVKMCKMCLFIAPNREEMLGHIGSVHEDVDEDEEEEFDLSGEENEVEATKSIKFLSTVYRRNDQRLFEHAYKWTMKFQTDHFSRHLFAEFASPGWSLLAAPAAAGHVPRLAESCDVAQHRANRLASPLGLEFAFRRYALFASELHADGKLTMFVGGPVSAIAWLPTPHERAASAQLVAVAVLATPDETYLTTRNYAGRSAIQFWAVGALANGEGVRPGARLAFHLAHAHGAVWCMEWCPSGCYSEQRGRMGLLAVAGCDCVVYVYSVPFVTDRVAYYKAKPAIKLYLQRPGGNLLGNTQYYPTRISWTKSKGHRHIAVGYSNGQVALFNLKATSVMLKFESEGVCCLLPEKNFQAHSHAISLLHLHHLNDGNRWLLTGSFDRGLSLWDLNNFNYPVYTYRKNIISSGFWLTHWISFFIGYDESSTGVHLIGALKRLRDFGNPHGPTTLTKSWTTIAAAGCSDWLNGIIQGNSAGEILANFHHEVLTNYDNSRLWQKKRWCLGYCILVDKNKTGEERVKCEKEVKKLIRAKSSKVKNFNRNVHKMICDEPLTYDETQKRYGLVFCDNEMSCLEDVNQSLSNPNYAWTKFNQYPMTGINAIAFNPNRTSSLFYATAYQAGFLRISWLGLFKDDPQIP